jgi:hypothetical protein
MDNVRAFAHPVNPTIDEVVQFLDAKAKCGDHSPTSARLQITSIRALAERITPEEPQNDAVFLLNNIDVLKNRWATLNTESKGETAHTYAIRTKTALTNFFAWKENPSGFRFERRRSPTTKKKPESGGSSSSSRPEARMPDPSASAPQAPPAPPPASYNHRFKVAPEKYVLFTLPEGGLSTAEWKRWVAHVYTMCEDFDPEAPSPIVSQSIVRG